MSEEKKYKNYTATDIEKYHKGLLSFKEMHELEEAALDDPFLAEALEGYHSTTLNVESDLAELEKRLKERIEEPQVVPLTPRGQSFKWWKVAAAVIVIGSLGFLTFQLLSNKKHNSIAKLDQKKQDQAAAIIAPDSNKSSTADTTTVASTTKREEVRTTVAAKKMISNKSKDKISDSNNFVSTETIAPVAAIPNSNEEKNLPTAKRSVDDNSTRLAKTKKSGADSAQQGIAIFNGKQTVLKDQEEMNYFRGRVVDEYNNPLAFANITNIRDNVGTYADARGNFTLISPDSVLNVQVRSLGFEKNFTQLKSNAASTQIIMKDDKVAPNKILSSAKPEANRSEMAKVKLEEPEPADGWTNYNQYMANNINVPDDIRTRRNVGEVQVSFDVNQNGEPVDIKVEKSLCQKCDQEAVRLIREGPKWKGKTKATRRATVTVPFDTRR